MLAESGLVSGAALQRARRLEAESGERIDRIAAKLGLVSERDLAAAYAQLIGSPVLDPTDFPDEPVAAGRIGRAFLKQPRMIPLVESEDALVVAMADPLDDAAALARHAPRAGREAGGHPLRDDIMAVWPETAI